MKRVEKEIDEQLTLGKELEKSVQDGTAVLLAYQIDLAGERDHYAGWILINDKTLDEWKKSDIYLKFSNLNGDEETYKLREIVFDSRICDIISDKELTQAFYKIFGVSWGRDLRDCFVEHEDDEESKLSPEL